MLCCRGNCQVAASLAPEATKGVAWGQSSGLQWLKVTRTGNSRGGQLKEQQVLDL